MAKFKLTMQMYCTKCNYDQEQIFPTWWQKIRLFLGVPVKLYCPNCDELTDHYEIKELPDDWRDEL